MPKFIFKVELIADVESIEDARIVLDQALSEFRDTYKQLDQSRKEYLILEKFMISFIGE